MKKLITILSALSLSATTSVAVVACSPDKDQANDVSNNPSQPPYTLSELSGLNLDLGDVSGELAGPGSFKTPLAQKFLELNADILVGIKVSDFYIATGTIDVEKGTAVVTGTNTGSNITYGANDGVTVTFTPVAKEVTKLSEINNLELNIGEVKSNKFYDIASKFVEVNLALLPKGITVENASDAFYITVNTQANSATITGKNDNQFNLSVVADNGVTVQFTLPDPSAKHGVDEAIITLSIGQTQAAATAAIEQAIQAIASATITATVGTDFTVVYKSSSAEDATTLGDDAVLAFGNIAIITATSTSTILEGSVTITVE